jgi:hypothetical protein
LSYWDKLKRKAVISIMIQIIGFTLNLPEISVIICWKKQKEIILSPVVCSQQGKFQRNLEYNKWVIICPEISESLPYTLYKGDAKDNVGNYRPISVLSVISKVFERIVFDQLYTYFNEML